MQKIEHIVDYYCLQIAEESEWKEKEASYEEMKLSIKSLKDRLEESGFLFDKTALRMDIDLSAFMYKKLPDFVDFLEEQGFQFSENAFNYLMTEQLWSDTAEANQTFIHLCEKFSQYTLLPNIIYDSLIGINPYIDMFEPLISIYEKGECLIFSSEFLEKNTENYTNFDIHDNLTLIKYVMDRYQFNHEDYDLNNENSDLFLKSVFETTQEYLLSKGITLKNNLEEYHDKMPELLRNAFIKREKEKLMLSLLNDSSSSVKKRL